MIRSRERGYMLGREAEGHDIIAPTAIHSLSGEVKRKNLHLHTTLSEVGELLFTPKRWY